MYKALIANYLLRERRSNHSFSTGLQKFLYLILLHTSAQFIVLVSYIIDSQLTFHWILHITTDKLFFNNNLPAHK
ncbi:unnamed protein product [Schistosoma intercalatum]|nr:unnamed protein product [Schistosoma intercalatum]CAH8629076.1 unnamed protein product [Schistosoma intercalatum]